MRIAVDLPKAYRLLNHGPTVLVSARHDGRDNVMAAAWCMALDFEPAKLALVLDKTCLTRSLLLASGRFAVSVPCQAQARLVTALGTHSGHQQDKLRDFGVSLLDEPAAASPLVGGCVAWLDCERMAEPDIEQRHDLFVGRVTGAWADRRVFDGGHWHFEQADDALRTLHHVAGGHYLAIGAEVAPAG
jgi:flavin reductase (DIM6/NTAB) family NADH-FMN oxidoreductase RutF